MFISDSTQFASPEGSHLTVQQASSLDNQFYAALKTADYLTHKHFDVTNPSNLIEQALNEYTRALEMNPGAVHVQGRMAKLFLKQGHYEKAEQWAKKVLIKESSNSDALFVQGYLSYKKRQFDSSIRLLSKAIQAKGGLSNSRTHFCLGYALHEHARGKQHNFLTRLALRTQSIGEFATGFCMLLSENDRVPFSAVLKMLPVITDAFCKEQAGDYAGALNQLLSLYEKFSGMPTLMVMIGNLYANKGNFDEAIFWFQKALQRDPCNENALNQLAHILEQEGQFEYANEYYQRLNKLQPNNPDVYCCLANTFYMSGNIEESVRHYKMALQSGRGNAEWQANIARTLAKIYHDHFQNLDAAQLALQSAIEFSPEDTESYIHLGVLYFEKQDFENAELTYQQAIRVNPNNAQLFSSLGYLKWMNNDIEQAVSLYEKAIQLEPQYDIPHNNLGVIYMDYIGNMHKAQELLQNATELNETYALAYYNLGRVHSFMGQKLEAAACFQKAQYLNEYTKELDTAELEDRINQLFNSN